MSVWKHFKIVASEKTQSAPKCENKDLHQYFVLNISYWRTFRIKLKTFLRPLPTLFPKVNLCSCVCWRWYFLPDKSHKRLSTILFSLLPTEGSGSPKRYSLCVAQWCYNENYAISIGHNFTKAAKPSKSWLSSMPTPITSRSILHQIKTYSSLALQIVNLCFVVIIEFFGFQIVQVLCFDGWKLLPLIFRYWVSIVSRIGWVFD